ncbi:MAG: M28 family peptidase [Bacteroidota bacterium]
MRHLRLPAIAALIILAVSCKNDAPKETEATNTPARPQVSVPAFSADSAYEYVGRQVAYGPRVPGSKAQQQCAGWMAAKLSSFCDTVYRQSVQVKGGDGSSLPCINLIGSINPGAPYRILFLTHWDSRPWADEDTKDKDKPILAADDGGSGVGVLLEVARMIKDTKLSPAIGIDILFTDVEDYGKSEWGEDSYCLGTQYWAQHPHIPGYKASYGILLDMVGARNARFPLEGLSAHFAPDVQQRVWQAASAAGYSSFFPYVQGPQITDDHLPINKMAGIKTIDVIHLSADPENPFPPHWHTHADAMDIIDKATLKAVGQTMLQVIYEEAATQGQAGSVQ